MKTLYAKQKGKLVPFTISDEDYEEMVKCKWYICNRGYVYRNIKKNSLKKIKLLHRLILNLENGNKLQGDHKDRNKLNNQRDNLRHATISENRKNSKSKGKIPYLGVYKRSDNFNKYKAKIKYQGIYINLGQYSTPEQAARVYDEAAKKYHGEFANLNFNE